MIIFFATLIPLGSCQQSHLGGSSSKEYKEATRITFEFHDSSVPPEYHRSTTLTVTPTTLRYTVDSYGDIIKDTSITITEEKFKQCIDAISTHKMRSCDMGKDDGCTGGTGHSLTVMKDSEVLLKGSIYHCGGGDYGTLCGDYKALERDFEKGLPPGITSPF